MDHPNHILQTVSLASYMMDIPEHTTPSKPYNVLENEAY